MDATRLSEEKILRTSSVGREEIPQGSRVGRSDPGKWLVRLDLEGGEFTTQCD